MEVVVRVAWAGICGSDLHKSLWSIFIPLDHKDSLTGGDAPLALGNEFSGVVQAIGNKVTKFQVGEHGKQPMHYLFGKDTYQIATSAYKQALDEFETYRNDATHLSFDDDDYWGK